MARSAAAGVRSMIITGGCLKESRSALELAASLGDYNASSLYLLPFNDYYLWYARALCYCWMPSDAFERIRNVQRRTRSVSKSVGRFNHQASERQGACCCGGRMRSRCIQVCQVKERFTHHDSLSRLRPTTFCTRRNTTNSFPITIIIGEEVLSTFILTL
jgi:hypothetical protein